MLSAEEKLERYISAAERGLRWDPRQILSTNLTASQADRLIAVLPDEFATLREHIRLRVHREVS